MREPRGSLRMIGFSMRALSFMRNSIATRMRELFGLRFLGWIGVSRNGGTEILDSGVDEIGERFCEDTMNVDLPLKEIEEGVGLGEGDEVQKNGGGGSIRKNIEDLDKFKYISSSGVNRSGKVMGVGGRLELSSTFSVLSSNAAKQTVKGTLAAKNQIMKDLLDALKMVAGELDDGSGEDVDFLETAKKCGMTFPRPRWWPQDGYDD